LKRIVRVLTQARASSEGRIGKIIAGIEGAAQRLNSVFGPIMLDDPPEGR
jgi:hypothetical protein